MRSVSPVTDRLSRASYFSGLLGRQRAHALACPTQRRHRIPARNRIHQRFQSRSNVGSFSVSFLRPPPGRPDTLVLCRLIRRTLTKLLQIPRARADPLATNPCSLGDCLDASAAKRLTWPRPRPIARVMRSSITGASALNFVRIASMVAIERRQHSRRKIYFHQTVPLFPRRLRVLPGSIRRYRFAALARLGGWLLQENARIREGAKDSRVVLVLVTRPLSS